MCRKFSDLLNQLLFFETLQDNFFADYKTTSLTCYFLKFLWNFWPTLYFTREKTFTLIKNHGLASKTNDLRVFPRFSNYHRSNSSWQHKARYYHKGNVDLYVRQLLGEDKQYHLFVSLYKICKSKKDRFL